LYLAHLSGLTDSELVASGLAQDSSPLVRWTAALVELRTLKERASVRAIEEVASAFPDSPVMTLAVDVPLLAQAFFDPEFTCGLLSCVFGEPPGVIPESLSERHKQILRFVAERTWPYEDRTLGSDTYALWLFGLAEDPDAVQALLGGEMPLRRSGWPQAATKVSHGSERAEGERWPWWRFW
jgi:hypothetical protein